MQASQLKAGAFYRFSHSGKGEFFAIFRGVEPQAEDEDFVRVDIWTGPGSSQERYANSMLHLGGNRKVTPLLSSKLLRSSQITDINSPGEEDQRRLRESVANSDREDYTPFEPLAYTPPPRHRVAPPAAVRSNTAMRYGVPAAIGAAAIAAAIVKVLA